MAARRSDQGREYPARCRALAGFIAASAVFVAVFAAVALSAFHEPTPHDLPVSIVASAAATAQVEHALDGAAPGAFRFRGYRSQATATTGIEHREVDGALVVSGANIVFGIPVSGGPANLASFTPGFLRVLFPVLPLGVAASTVRDVVYFDGHGISPYIWTLTAWGAAGVTGLILVAALRRPARTLAEP